MNAVMQQSLFGNRPIRDAASGKIALITQDRNLNFRGTTRPVAALGEWQDTFGSITKGASDLANSVANIIGSIKGNTTNIVSPNTGGYPVQGMYYGQQPYYGVNPMIPSYNYPTPTPTYTAPKKDNTLLYTGLGVAAVAGLIFLKNK
jgi:hypothetical protein